MDPHPAPRTWVGSSSRGQERHFPTCSGSGSSDQKGAIFSCLYKSAGRQSAGTVSQHTSAAPQLLKLPRSTSNSKKAKRNENAVALLYYVFLSRFSSAELVFAFLDVFFHLLPVLFRPANNFFVIFFGSCEPFVPSCVCLEEINELIC